MNTKETIKILTEHSGRLSQQTYTPDNRDLMEAIDFAVKRLSGFVNYKREIKYDFQKLQVGEKIIVEPKEGESVAVLQDRVRAAIGSHTRRAKSEAKFKTNQMNKGVKITRVA